MRMNAVSAQERGLLILLGLAIVATGVLLILDRPQAASPVHVQTIPLSEVRILLPRFITIGPINVNTATVEELQSLKGIGPALARKIIEYRTLNGPFETLNDLQAISGIGPLTIEGFDGRAVARSPQ